MSKIYQFSCFFGEKFEYKDYITLSETESSTKDVQPTLNALNKVNSSEFDPLQENKSQKNGNALEQPKESAKNLASNNEKPTSRPQSVPSMQREPVAVSAASSASQQLSDYYNRNPPTSYSQIPYGSVPYPPQHYAYSAAGYVFSE